MLILPSSYASIDIFLQEFEGVQRRKTLNYDLVVNECNNLTYMEIMPEVVL
jgi:hypothetical protein